VIRAIAIAVLFGGMMIGGYQLATAISQSPSLAATITRPGQTQVVVHTRVVKKVVKGRVVTLKSGQRVIVVPRVVIHNLRCHPTRHHHCARWIVVPAHRVPIPAAPISAVATAAPLIPVTVTVTDVQTVTQPAVTVTVPGPTTTVTGPTTTDVTTETDTQTITVTITIPSPPEGTQ
jgi:hypothetical protein